MVVAAVPPLKVAVSWADMVTVAVADLACQPDRRRFDAVIGMTAELARNRHSIDGAPGRDGR